MGVIEIEYVWPGISTGFKIIGDRVCPECGRNHFFMTPSSKCFECGWKGKLEDTITINEYKLKLLDKSIEEQLNEG